MLVDGPAPFTAKTITEAEFLYVDANEFKAFLSKLPALAQRWAPKLAVQVVRAHLRVSELLGKNLTEQVARVLVNEYIEGVFPHSQGTLAGMLGSHRSPLNQVLKELERRKVLKLGYRRIEIRDISELQKLAAIN